MTGRTDSSRRASISGLSALGMATLAALAAAPARAATDFTYVTNFSKNGNLQTNLNAKYPSGLFNTTAFGGVSFDITQNTSGNNFAAFYTGSPLTISVDIPDATNVYTLLNDSASIPGTAGAVVTFAGTGGASETFTLTNGSGVRNYENALPSGTINGTTTQNVFSVTDKGGAGTSLLFQNANANNGLTGTYRLDAQDFTLDSAFAGQTLTSITLRNGLFNVGDFLSGVTVASASPAPEPSQVGMLSLIGLGLGGLALNARRKSRPA